jgi:hypothetical protein
MGNSLNMGNRSNMELTTLQTFKNSEQEENTITTFEMEMENFIKEILHLCTFKSPTLSADMNEQCDADCALKMRNGVKI